MKFLLAVAAFVGLATSFSLGGDCTEDLQVKCVDDVKVAYPPCKKAAQSGGTDMVSVLTCMKYFTAMEKDCWPCVCAVANA